VCAAACRFRPSAKSICSPVRAGFTLVELLVVITIIAVLAALIFVMVGKTREKAKAIVCINNLRQIGSALAAYAADNDGVMPPHVEQYID
jgi:prepilin-type N-terminal cleavage/methylation domain-containing protein